MASPGPVYSRCSKNVRKETKEGAIAPGWYSHWQAWPAGLPAGSPLPGVDWRLYSHCVKDMGLGLCSTGSDTLAPPWFFPGLIPLCGLAAEFSAQ
jgi:hypothetical protein